MTRLVTLLFCLSGCLAAQLTPRAGWKWIPGAEDLIAAGNWTCVNGVAADAGGLTVAAPSTGFNTVINTSGPMLRITGDFSVLARLEVPRDSTASMVTLVGSPGSGTWWNGLRRLDAGVANGNFQMSYWLGGTPNPSAMQTFGPVPAGDSMDLEVAHVGSHVILYVNGAEAGRLDDPGLFTSGQVFPGFNLAPSNSLRVTALAGAIPQEARPGAGDASLYDPSTQAIPRLSAGLRDISARQGFLLGAAVDPAQFSNAAYARTLGQQMNLAVAENAMKFGATEPGPDRYNFCQADQVVRFAQANGMKVRAHNLVWHQSLPAWLTAGNYTPADAAKILQDHIRSVMEHFRGKVLAWDVVNEAISYGAPYGAQPSYWLTQLGSGYVEQAFRWAREADPDVKLFYNDTGGEGLGAKSDAIYNLVSGLVSKGVPIDGVGLEMHVDINHAPSAADVSANIRRLGRLGLEVHITEMDVRIPVSGGAPSTVDLIAQANVYSSMLGACLDNANCTAFLTWGVSDAASWIPAAYPGYGAALLFDAQFQGKPAASSLLGTLTQGAARPHVFYRGAVLHGGPATTVSPGSLVDLYGSALAPGVLVPPGGAASLPLQLDSTQVIVNALPAPLLYASPGQIIFQLPYEVPVGAASVVVRGAAGDSAPVTLPVRTAAPGILTWNGNRAVVLNQNLTVNSASNCAVAGSTGVLYGIGSGPLDNPVATGGIAPLAPLSRESLPTQVTVGGQSAAVLFAGLAPGFAGLMQINFTVPANVTGDVPVQMTIGTAVSNAPVMCVDAVSATR